MSRLVRTNTIQRAVRQYNTLSKQTFSHAKRTSLARINLSNSRQTSSKAASDGTLLLLGLGALAASSALVMSQVYSGLYRASMMEPFTQIVNGQKPLFLQKKLHHQCLTGF